MTVVDRTRGVIVLYCGGAWAERAAVCLWSLRQHWPGPVAIFASPDCWNYASRLAEAAGAELIGCPRPDFRRNGHYLLKTQLYRTAPYQRNLLLDLDTLVVGRVHELFDRSPLTVTHFAGWQSTGRRMRRRIEPWRDVSPMAAELVAQQLAEAWPAINTGVVCFDRDWWGCPVWESLTAAAKDSRGNPRFIADELAMQILLPLFGTDLRVVDDRFNASPFFATHRGRRRTRVWHFHGDKHLKKEAGAKIWWPAFEAARTVNFAGLAEWAGETDPWVRSRLATERGKP